MGGNPQAVIDKFKITRLDSNGNIAASGYACISGSNIVNIQPGNNVNQVLSGIQISDGTTVAVKDSDDKSALKTTDKMGTGTIVKFTSDGNTTQYTAVIYGDVNGDGNIDVLDLAKIKSHLLKNVQLSDAFLKAGSIFSKNKVTISDLLAIKKQILNIQSINQYR